MHIVKNPDDEAVTSLCGQSPHNAAKWIRDLKTGDVYYAAAGDFQHAEMAALLHVEQYEKGLAVPED